MDIVRDVFQADGEAFANGADLRELPNWDSLNHMNFIAALEREYRIELTGDEIAEMISLDIIQRILKDRYGLEL